MPAKIATKNFFHIIFSNIFTISLLNGKAPGSLKTALHI